MKVNQKDFSSLACSRPLGIQDGRIPSSNISASSYLDRNFLPSYAKLFNKDRGGWCALKQDKNQFIQVDLGSVFTISGISTQGYQSYRDWVTSYKIVYKDENDVWKDYTIFGTAKVIFKKSMYMLPLKLRLIYYDDTKPHYH